jgi:lipopolysaccharide/colanic/teichoic acid biosynthesis glycosyltransferase
MPPLLDDSQLVPDLVATSESSPEPARFNVRSDRAQRALDILVGVASLIVAAPFLLVAMVAVKLTSRGPVIYCQSRLGRYGRPFVIYKIRSMTHNCEKQSGVKWCSKGDSRVTWVGRILRKTHIDELPQLINILRGDMSLVGPRPERPEIVVTLERYLKAYRGRLAVRPGLTGLAQVQLPPDTDMESARRKLQYDLHYVTNGTVWMDARLLVSTAFHIVRLPFAFSRLLLWLPGQPEVEPERSVTNPIVDPNADTAVHAICPATICEVSVDAARA